MDCSVSYLGVQVMLRMAWYVRDSGFNLRRGICVSRGGFTMKFKSGQRLLQDELSWAPCTMLIECFLVGCDTLMECKDITFSQV